MKTFRRTQYQLDAILTPYEYAPDSALLIEDDQIVAVGGISGFFQSSDIRVIPLRGVYALPGFIDTHIHGGAGFDATSAKKTLDRLPAMCAMLAERGISSFVPTLVSAPPEQLIESVETLVGVMADPPPGAQIVGLHMEGPFIAPEKAGSQRREDLLPIDLDLAQKIIQAGHGKIKIWTFAPELPNADKLIKLLRLNNIQPAMGHTNADADAILRAVDIGATRCTHLFNGMPPLHQRNVSLAAITLTDDRITADIILDGTHVDPRMVDLTCRTKKNSRIVGISDAVSGAGMEEGKYMLGNEEIYVENGRSFTTRNHILAGSAQTLDQGWMRLVTYAGLDNTAAAACFTINPALSIDLKDRGVLTPGKRADVVFYDSQTNKVVMTLIAGTPVFVAPHLKELLDAE